MIKRVESKTKIIWFLIIVTFIVVVFLTFFYVPKCKNIVCWEYKLYKCDKASYIADKKDIVWEYIINGKTGESCEVSVKVLEIKSGLTNSKVLEGKSMDCLLPIETLNDPESNPNICHGLLKEEMQTIIVNKLHYYILNNVGQISKELTQIEGVTNSIVGNFTNSNTTNSRVINSSI